MLQSDWSRASELGRAPVPSKTPELHNSTGPCRHYRAPQVVQQNKGLSSFRRKHICPQYYILYKDKLPCNPHTKFAFIFVWEWICQHIMAKLELSNKICLHWIDCIISNCMRLLVGPTSNYSTGFLPPPEPQTGVNINSNSSFSISAAVNRSKCNHGINTVIMGTDTQYATDWCINYCVCVMQMHFIDNSIWLECVYIRLAMDMSFSLTASLFCNTHLISYPYFEQQSWVCMLTIDCRCIIYPCRICPRTGTRSWDRTTLNTVPLVASAQLSVQFGLLLACVTCFAMYSITTIWPDVTPTWDGQTRLIHAMIWPGVFTLVVSIVRI